MRLKDGERGFFRRILAFWAEDSQGCHDSVTPKHSLPVREQVPSAPRYLRARGMTRLLELLVACIIVFVLAVLFGVVLPSHRHIERSVEVSSPVRQIFDTINDFRTYPSWNALKSYDHKVQLAFGGPESGPGAIVNWSSNDPRIGTGSLTVEPDVQQGKEVKW